MGERGGAERRSNRGKWSRWRFEEACRYSGSRGAGLGPRRAGAAIGCARRRKSGSPICALTPRADWDVRSTSLRRRAKKIVEQGKLQHDGNWRADHEADPGPCRLPQSGGLRVGGAHALAAYAAGGDCSDFIPLAPHLTGIVVGVAAGKGVAAAIIMALTRSLAPADAAHRRVAGRDPAPVRQPAAARDERLANVRDDARPRAGKRDPAVQRLRAAGTLRAAPQAAARRHDLQPPDLPWRSR